MVLHVGTASELDGKSYATDAADTETMLRIVQSIPSPKAEPFKQKGWRRWVQLPYRLH